MRIPIAAAVCLSLLAVGTPRARAENPLRLGVSVPQSSLQLPQDRGRRAHTNVRRLVLARAVTPDTAPYSGVFYETPASLACIYGLTKRVAGCNPQTVSRNASGGSNLVAIVDAYDDPTALSDLQAYSRQFGLPSVSASNFQVVYASGSQPAYNSGWQVEEALDTQMVHAMAPHAKIVLVEAASNYYSDLLAAEQVAANLVSAAGGGEVSNSWGGGEFPAETESYYTSPFTGTSVVFFASTGDGESPSFPAVLPGVVAVGGTSVSRNPTTGDYQYEVSWADAGAGPSVYVSRPSFQSAVAGTVGAQRSVPDISADANPDTGVWTLINSAWYVVGGTSAASPLIAGLTNAAGHFAVSANAELTAIYGNFGTADFHDVARGTCGEYQYYSAAKGWDFCTGVGSPANLQGE
jgi:subtilase family serine protease